MKDLYIRDLSSLAKGSMIEAEFAIKNVQLCPQKDGGRYLAFELLDATGSIKAKWWSRDESHCQALSAVRYGKIYGKVEDYQQKRSVVVTMIEDLGIPEDLSDFEAVSALPLSELTRRLDVHIGSIQNQHLASLLTLTFGNKGLRDSFEEAPAAMSNHHACRNGLLQHTLEVTDIAAAIADVQKTWGYDQPAERDLVVAGALLHDIGKILELGWGDGDIRYTRSGNLLGHMTLGTHLIAAKMSKVPGFPPLLREALLHIVAAHHGKLEWGSPVVPMMAEAQIVHTADLLDAQLFYMQEAESEAAEEFGWQRKLDNRRVFIRSEVIAPASVGLADTELLGKGSVMAGSIDGDLSNEDHRTGISAPVDSAGSSLIRTAIPVLRFTLASGTALDLSFATRRLPLIGNVAAGSPLAAEQTIEDQIDVEAAGLPSDPNTFLLRVCGDSMLGDGIGDGDLVVVRPQAHHEPEDIVVALLRGNNEAAIKRVELRGSQVFLISSNKDFAPILVPDPDDLQVRGRVVARLQVTHDVNKV